MRHADAAGAADAESDEDRPLTEKGQRQARRAGRLLKNLNVDLNLVLSSPLVRARQTAEGVLKAMDLRMRVRLLDDLAPAGDEQAAWQTIVREDPETLLVVGHLPSIASLAGALLGSLSDAPLHFHKASLVALKCERLDRRWSVSLDWMVTPTLTRQLSRNRVSRSAAQGARS